MDRRSTASLGQGVPCWTAQPLGCLRVGQPGPEQPGRREDGGGGKDREVLGATVRGQRGAGWEKEEGAGRELESWWFRGKPSPLWVALTTMEIEIRTLSLLPPLLIPCPGKKHSLSVASVGTSSHLLLWDPSGAAGFCKTQWRAALVLTGGPRLQNWA